MLLREEDETLEFKIEQTKTARRLDRMGTLPRVVQ